MSTQANTPAKRVSKIVVNDGQDHILVSKTGTGKYTIESFSGMKPGHDAFGFDLDACSGSVENLDFSSDFYDCFNTSTSVKVGECLFTTESIEGPTLEVIRKAAEALCVCSMDSQDV